MRTMGWNTHLGDRSRKAKQCNFGVNAARIHGLDLKLVRDPVFTADRLAAIRVESLTAGQRNNKCTGRMAENKQGA